MCRESIWPSCSPVGSSPKPSRRSRRHHHEDTLTPDLPDDHAVAAHIAGFAGAELLRVRTSRLAAGMTGRALGDQGDLAAQEVIAGLLARHRPGDAILSEEAADSVARLTADRVWIIDPLDGTREYSEGRDDWAVHVALWERGELTAGAVAVPGQAVVLSTADAGARFGVGTGGGDAPGGERALRVAVSRSRPPELVERLGSLLGLDLVPMGSAGVKIAAVVRGEVDAYVHAGGQYEWDSAAPVAVARAAGFSTCRVDGSPLVYNRADPYLPDLVVCHPRVSDALMTAIAAALQEGQ
jgi:3'(2'), 5'-bisphosphate nucleotidase